MIHLGDITTISGYDAPIVDVITGGSPCQDLSVAGKRAGLAGQRSGLFMEQMRIVKEMRERDVRDNGRTGWAVRPRYMVWENVPGAFSSGSPKGADFAAVIEEIIKVAEPDAAVQVCVPDGGWTKSGCYYSADGRWSIAWRVHDAQFWGVPQRRKRIALVADFGGLSAPEILFERKGLRGDLEPCGTAREESAGAAGGSADGAIGTISFQERAGKPGGGKGILIQREHVGALSTLNNQSVVQSASIGVDVYNQEITGQVAASLTAAVGGTNTSGAKVLAAGFSFGQSSKARSIGYEEELSPTLRGGGGGNQKPCVMQSAEPILLESNQNHATVQTDGISTALPASMGMGGGYVPMVTSVYDARGNGDGEIAPTMTGDHQNRVTDYTAIVTSSGSDVAGTLDASYYKGCGERQGVEREVVVCTGKLWDGSQVAPTLTSNNAAGGQRMPDKENFNAVMTYGVSSFGAYSEGTTSLRAQGGDNGGGSENIAVQNAVVRRLTPGECAALQGFPRDWCNIGDWVDSKGKKHKDADSPKYKAYGNSIALPFWQWLARRICAQYERNITMASLFDGIGGFPLVFERCGAKAVWASEIEDFPIAVTKKHFPEEEGT